MWERKYCGDCGAALSAVVARDDSRTRMACAACNKVDYCGPTVLIEVGLTTPTSLLLVQRAQLPYRGMWAPITGFVEPGETLEQAAAREIEEEVGIRLPPADLVPAGISSVPHLNQVYCTFIAYFDAELPVYPDVREVTCAKWFTQDQYPSDIWDPAHSFDVSAIYRHLRSRRFQFVQRNADFLRVFEASGNVRYVWKRS